MIIDYRLNIVYLLSTYESFVVVHRLCVNPVYQNQKIEKNTMIMIEGLLRKEGIQSIRLDAFYLNPYVLKMYETLGYQKSWTNKLEKRIILYCIHTKIILYTV